eukprot:7673285-Pyramimonas_sp.AAC.1
MSEKAKGLGGHRICMKKQGPPRLRTGNSSTRGGPIVLAEPGLNIVGMESNDHSLKSHAVRGPRLSDL